MLFVNPVIRKYLSKNLCVTIYAMGIIKHEKLIVDFFTGAGTGIVVSCLFSPDSSIRTAVIIVGIIMIGIGWYKKSKNDKKVFQYIKEQKDSEII